MSGRKPQRGALGKPRDAAESVAKAIENGGQITIETLTRLRVLLDEGRGDARTALLTAIRLALTARDERIAALESRCATLRSLVNVRGGDEATEQIAARVNADLARRAAEWERMADDVGAANVEASARIAALEAGLREACDLAKQASFYAHGDIGAEYREHVDRLRALADGKP